MSARLGSAVLSLLATLLAGRAAQACATCGSGDPTLTTAGTEQPFAGRLRSALEARYRTDRVGRGGLDQLQILELSTQLSLAWALRADLMLMAEVPMIYRRVLDANLARIETMSVGDLVLRAKWFAWRDRGFAPRALLSLIGGVELPTADFHEQAPLEAQPGSGSLDASLGPALALFAGSFSGYASALWTEPLASRDVLTPGRSLNASAALQHQPWPWLAGRALAQLRWDAQSLERGEPDPNSGGVMLACGAEFLLSPWRELTVVAGARAPVIQRWHGAHDEGPLYSLAFVSDF